TTGAASAHPGSPGRYYEALGTDGRTFARVVPNDRVEAKAIVSEVGSLGITQLYVKSDGTPYGKELALALTADASPSISVVSTASAAQAVFYAGSSTGAAAGVFTQAISQNPAVRLFAPSALYGDAL